MANLEPYNHENIFAKILRGEIPNDTVLETKHSLAFNDIAPQAPIHVLVIPKGAYRTLGEFSAQASADEITDFSQAVASVIDTLGIEEAGYRAITNANEDGAQEVPHYHLHILAGRKLGPLIST